jgi:hypothetical protein
MLRRRLRAGGMGSGRESGATVVLQGLLAKINAPFARHPGHTSTTEV